MSLTKSRVKQLRERLNAVLADFDDDVEITLGNATFSENNVTFKLFASVRNDEGETVSKMEEDFKHHAVAWGLSPEDFGRVFTNQGRRFTICGAKPRAHKYPILARAEDGTIYKFSARAVMQAVYA